MKRQIRFLVFFLILTVTALAVACPAGPAPTPTGELPPVKIGAIITYTGIGSTYAAAEENAIKLALDEVGWEVAGREIQLLTEDSATDPEVALAKAKKLVEADKVDALVGLFFSHNAAAVLSYTDPLGIPYVGAGCHGTDISTLPTVFMRAGTLIGNGYYTGLYAYELGYRTASTILVDYVCGEEFLGGFAEGFQERGGTIIQEQRTPIGTMDFAPYVTEVNREADCLAMYVLEAEGVGFYKTVHEYGLDMPIIWVWIGGGIARPQLEQIGEYAVGSFGQTFYNPWETTPNNVAFNEAYMAKYGEHPGSVEEGHYSAVLAIVKAIEATGGDTTHEKVLEALKTIEVDTPAGKLSFNEEGLGTTDAIMVKVVEKNGEYVYETIKKYPGVVFKAPSE